MQAMKEGIIQDCYEISQTNEISVDWDGNNYLVIYGRHMNGWFIAIPNWQTSTEAAHPSDSFYNMEKLTRALKSNEAARAIADALRAHWKYMEHLREEQKEKMREKEQAQEEQEKNRGKRVR